MDKQIPLGQATDYVFTYNPDVLFAVPRSETRQALGLGQNLPFAGVDVWTAYEVSWLDGQGMPQVAIAEFIFPCESPNLVESKSFKLYLNSFNQTQFASEADVISCMQKDLSACCGAEVLLTLLPVTHYPVRESDAFLCIDQQAIACDEYHVNAHLLGVTDDVQHQQLCSHVFRSLCPVTGQPDWASVFIDCHGKRLDQEKLLRYLVSYRLHQGFHEQCVEMIFNDVLAITQAEQLTVTARFVRRGGLDINPIRSTHAVLIYPERQARQ